MAYVNANVSVTAHRVVPLQNIVDLVGEEVRTYLQRVARMCCFGCESSLPHFGSTQITLGSLQLLG
jgi:hypothetical protein